MMQQFCQRLGEKPPCDSATLSSSWDPPHTRCPRPVQFKAGLLLGPWQPNGEGWSASPIHLFTDWRLLEIISDLKKPKPRCAWVDG